MKFTASDKWNVFAKAAHKQLRIRVFVRLTTNLAADLATGTWHEITHAVTFDTLGKSQVEYLIGQFTTDSMDFTGHGIAHYKSIIFAASTSQYIEIKVTVQLGNSGDWADDECIIFSGYVDKTAGGIQYHESTDTVDFTAYTAQDIGYRIAAENLTTQYIATAINGTDNGLILENIPGVYVLDANIAGFVLPLGVHTIEYRYNEGTPALYFKGDSALIAGDNTTYTLTDPSFNQKIKLYVKETDWLPQEDKTDKVIVTTEGATLPQNWFKTVSVAWMLRECYRHMGITEVYMQSLDYPVAPGQSVTEKISYLDVAAPTISPTSPRQAMTTDATDLYIGVAGRVYRRNMTPGFTYGTYDLLIDLVEEGDVNPFILKLMYNARNDHLWLYYIDAAGAKVRRYDFLADPPLSASVLLNAINTRTREYTVELFDYNYSGSSWHYSIVYVDTDVGVREIDGATLGISLVMASVVPSRRFITDFMHQMASGIIRVTSLNTTSEWGYEEIQLDSSNVWQLNSPFGHDGSFGAGYKLAAYNPVTDAIYFHEDPIGDIYYHTPTNATFVPVYFLTGDAAGIYTIQFDGVDAVYAGVRSSGSTLDGISVGLVKITGLTQVDIATVGDVFYGTFAGTPRGIVVCRIGNNAYGLNSDGKIWSYGPTLQMWVKSADFENMSVSDVVNELLTNYNIAATISSTKKAYVLPRGNASGTALTTGNSIAITVDDATDISETIGYAPKAALVEIDNGTVRRTYNGTAYNREVLTDAHKVSKQGTYIPDELVPDLAYYFYQFFKTERHLYRIPVGIMPLLQYEPFDGASITFTTTKIQKTASGPIMGVEVGLDGSMTFDVLLEA